jgi:DNA repair exonuclease SbcCD ATPase subunit
MGHARLVSLRLKGFRSFINESEINFPESGMMLFRGRNLDSGGSSGSGKSSLLLAITYLLGFCRFPATALQSWLTEEPLQVTGTFEVDDGKGARRELVISRGQKLTLSLNGTEVEGSAKQLEDKITKYIGLPPELLAALTYRGQKQPGLFLSKTDAQKKEFLTTLLDLGKFEEQVERSTATVKTLESKVQGSEYLVAKLTSDIQGRRENFKPALVADEKNLQSQLDMALAHSDRIRGQVAAIRAKVKSFEAGVEDGALKIRAEAQARINELNAAISDLEDAEPDLSKIDSSLVMDAENDLKVAQGFLDDELKADQARYKTQRQTRRQCSHAAPAHREASWPPSLASRRS